MYTRSTAHVCTHCLQEYCVTEFLRMSGVYWCLTAMDLMGQLERLSKEQVLAFVKDCQKPSGGFSPAPDHDAHLLYTLSAIQVNEYCDVEAYYSSMRVTVQ